MGRPTLQCGDHFIKSVLFFFNLLIVLVSVALLLVAASVLFKWSAVTDFLELGSMFELIPEAVSKWAAWGTLGVGGIMFLISFLGCCGAISENHCMVLMYSVCLFVIIILQVIVGVVVYTQINVEKYSNSIKKYSELDDHVRSKLTSQATVMIDHINAIQKTFSCCGIYGPSEYSDSMPLPKSCCTDGADRCVKDVAFEGCMAQFEKNESFFIGGAIGILCAEVITAILGLCLVHSLKNVENSHY